MCRGSFGLCAPPVRGIMCTRISAAADYVQRILAPSAAPLPALGRARGVCPLTTRPEHTIAAANLDLWPSGDRAAVCCCGGMGFAAPPQQHAAAQPESAGPESRLAAVMAWFVGFVLFETPPQ